MECHDAAPFVSVLHDGEHVPADYADHIDACPNCRASLRSYSDIGAELRLLASRAREATVVPEPLLYKLNSERRPSMWAFWRGRMLVPRFAVITAAAAFVAVSAGLMIVQAQSQPGPRWFQFEVVPEESQASDGQSRANNVAQAGYDEGMVTMTPVLDASGRPMRGDQMHTVGIHFAVYSIKDGRVQLGVRSRRFKQGDPAIFDVKNGLGDLKHFTFTYTPGETLKVPIEGGGSLLLRGQIADHQPKFAWGFPVEPGPDQLVLTHPVVIKDHKTLLANIEGGSALADKDGTAFLAAKDLGRLTISLRPLPNSVQGQATWGKLEFKLNGQSYTLFSASPICGGEQPHAVWVSLEPDDSTPDGTIGSSSGPLQAP